MFQLTGINVQEKQRIRVKWLLVMGYWLLRLRKWQAERWVIEASQTVEASERVKGDP